MTVSRFEELEVWKDAKELVIAVYRATSQSPLNKDFGYKDQIQRAAISIMNNIAEGFERNNNKEFVRFLSFSKGSAGEVRSMLYVARDLEYISKQTFQELYNLSLIILKRIVSFQSYLKRVNTK